jgi:CheY-like chemotaxis protein
MRDVLGEAPPSGSEPTQKALARVLLVEDSNFFRKYTASVLQASHFDVHAVSNGLEALEHLRQAPQNAFDLVLTDIDMPGMNGFDLARELRASDAWFKQTPIIALTSLVSQRDKLTAKAAGIDEHIEKVNLDKIPALLADVLGRLWQGIKGGAA